MWLSRFTSQQSVLKHLGKKRLTDGSTFVEKFLEDPTTKEHNCFGEHFNESIIDQKIDKRTYE